MGRRLFDLWPSGGFYSVLEFCWWDVPPLIAFAGPTKLNRSVIVSKQRQTNRKCAASRPYRWRCRGARRSLCPKRGWSLFGSSLRSLRKFKQPETLVAATVSQRSTNAPASPLMFVMSMLSWVSFSHVRSMHSYTDCRISFGSSSTHLGGSTHNQIRWFRTGGGVNEGSFFYSPFLWEALLDLHLVMAEELSRFRVEHLQKRKNKWPFKGEPVLLCWVGSGSLLIRTIKAA